MTGDLEIRAGGAIAVDTATLRHAATQFSQLARECEDADGLLRRAEEAAREHRLPLPFPVIRVDLVENGADDIALALRRRADVYEEIERSISARFAGVAGPRLGEEAATLLDGWWDDRHSEVERQLRGAVAPSWDAAFVMAAVLRGLREIGLGLVPPAAGPLRHHAGERRVAVWEVSRDATTPPRTLAEIARRIPSGGDGRVRVERYPGADGATQHIVYIAGTSALGSSSDDPWDMTSNVELYTRRRSDSFAAVEKAVAAAGVRPGEAVHLVGYSQGGMLATHLARESAFDVRSLITFASPVQAQLPDDVLQITIRHTDDPVAALALDGMPAAAGSRESLVVERVADRVPRPSDLLMGAHMMAAYEETASLVDANLDPRLSTLRAQLEGLAPAAGSGAAAATAFVYGARRESPAPPPARAPGAGNAPSAPSAVGRRRAVSGAS